MLFNSYIFILFLFPVSLIGYFGLNRFKRYKCAKCLLIIISLYFYAYFNFYYLFILVGSILVNFLISRVLTRRSSKFLLIIGIVINAGAIFYYKYYDFFVDSFNAVFKTNIPLLNLLMPLGISFFTFQQISFLVDSYKGECSSYSFIDYALFVCFFPQLIAGPIVLHEEMIPQFIDEKKKKVNPDNLSKGIFIFSVGLAKKVLLADILAPAVDWGHSNIQALSGFNALLVAVIYSFQLYFDFSGYCDMAYGIGLCFNIELPMNFNSPYKATSVAEFWKRWHMTLTRFLTKYVYIPLGGNRKGKLRSYLNIFIVFLVSGIWHGANWTFIVWGLIHGIASVLYRIFGRVWDKVVKPIAVAVNFLFVSLAFVFFRAKDIHSAFVFTGKIFTDYSFRLNADFLRTFDTFELSYIENHIYPLKQFVTSFPAANMLLLAVISCLLIWGTKNVYQREFKTKAANAFACIILLVWSVISLSGISTFLYFNF